MVTMTRAQAEMMIRLLQEIRDQLAAINERGGKPPSPNPPNLRALVVEVPDG